MLYREPKLLKGIGINCRTGNPLTVSVLYREPKLLKDIRYPLVDIPLVGVSVLYREPKLLKGLPGLAVQSEHGRFSALP